jgi:lipopolysaccharide/colanic/teichoic acid biosynthesis glycosyltransferase
MRLKRAFDIAMSAAALLLLLPVMVLIGAAVWLESGRPIFFGQTRMGRDFRPFRIMKFRSMRAARGPSITVAGDRRVTRVGAILRASKMDELPQFWNVLRGEMSLVGPRPEVLSYVDLYRREYAPVLAIRPGITDLASLAYRREETLLAAQADPERFYREVLLPSKLKLADEYIQRRSFWLDLQILIRTVRAAAIP